jgi:hypothetical protein
MSFPARVFRVLIASPSDVAEEREIAVRTIQEWNDLNAAERQLVLLPLRWETHSAPEYGKRPQEIINRQVVDHCDLLIGIFWTRIGSPTGLADSGTLEEIERVANSGRPVMLYFSQAKQDPEKLDLDQLAKLRAFKKMTFPSALTESFSGQVEFRDKLSRQLEIQLRALLASESDGSMIDAVAPPHTDIQMSFAEVSSGECIGKNLAISTRYLEIGDFEEIPDFAETQESQSGGAKRSKLLRSYMGESPNKDYYRQLATYQVLQAFFTPIRFWLKNRGGVGARDVYIDIQIKSPMESLVVVSASSLPTSPPSRSIESFGLLSLARHASNPQEAIFKGSGSWSTKFEIPALQPQREITPEPLFLIGALQTCELTIGARIYADTLAEPEYQELKLQLDVEKISLTASQVLTELETHKRIVSSEG